MKNKMRATESMGRRSTRPKNELLPQKRQNELTRTRRDERIAQKRRFFGFAVAVVLVVGFACGCATAKSTAEQSETIHVVRQGETVWDIAKQYCPKGEDVRRFAFEIAGDNEIKDYIIHAGDVLKIRK